MKNKIVQSAAFVVLITIIIKLLGFGRELVLAYFFNASAISDAYLLASDIMTILFGWITAFAVVYTPIFSNIIVKESREKGLNYTRKIIIIVSILACVAIIITELFPSFFVSITASGLAAEQKTYVVQFLRIVIFSVGLNALCEIFISYLNLNEAYIISNSICLPFNIMEILAIALAGYYKTPILMAYGVVSGNLIKLALAYWASRKRAFRFVGKGLRRDEYIRDTWVMFLPVFLSNMLVEINTLIDKSFASYLETGSVTLLNYGAVTRRFIFNIFSVIIASIFFPKFSKIIAENERNKATKIFEKAINGSVVIFAPITFLAVIFASDAIDILFNRGSFSEKTVDVAIIFASYCLGLTAMILNEICSKVVYAYKNSKLPMFIGVFTIVFNLICNFVLIKNYQAMGLALATSLSQTLVIPIYLVLIKKCIFVFDVKSIVNNVIQTVINCVVPTLFLILLNKITIVHNIYENFRLVIAIIGALLFIFIYLMLMCIQKNKAIVDILSYVGVKEKRK